jgi:hypothetical protein
VGINQSVPVPFLQSESFATFATPNNAHVFVHRYNGVVLFIVIQNLIPFFREQATMACACFAPIAVPPIQPFDLLNARHTNGNAFFR